MCVRARVCMCERKTQKGKERKTWLPQQLCHYVGGNYESNENGEGGEDSDGVAQRL